MKSYCIFFFFLFVNLSFGEIRSQVTRDLVERVRARSSLPADDASWTYAGSDREAAKTRRPAVINKYQKLEPMSLADFYKMVRPLKVPAKVPPEAMVGLEDVVVTLNVYLLAARFERKEDHDIHFQGGDSPNWNTDQLIMEIPAEPEFELARKTLWDIIRQDSGRDPDNWILKKPVKIQVTGALFLDAHHRPKGATNLDIENGGRGIQNNGVNSVKGLWEIHPVTDVKILK